jgi:DUF1365 family protein
VSFFYCFDGQGTLRHVLAEVNNTFGGSQVYWLTPDTGSRTFRASAVKSLYVSPFMPADMSYRFALTPPADHLVVHMDALESGAAIFDATLSLERRPWSAGEIRRQLARHPVMTAQVMAAIHWQALKLWWKGVPLAPRPASTGADQRPAVMGR